MPDKRYNIRRSDGVPQDVAQEAILVLRYLLFKEGKEITIPLDTNSIDDFLDTELKYHAVLCKRNTRNDNGDVTSITLSLRRKEDVNNE